MLAGDDWGGVIDGLVETSFDDVDSPVKAKVASPMSPPKRHKPHGGSVGAAAVASVEECTAMLRACSFLQHPGALTESAKHRVKAMVLKSDRTIVEHLERASQDGGRSLQHFLHSQDALKISPSSLSLVQKPVPALDHALQIHPVPAVSRVPVPHPTPVRKPQRRRKPADDTDSEYEPDNSPTNRPPPARRRSLGPPGSHPPPSTPVTSGFGADKSLSKRGRTPSFFTHDPIGKRNEHDARGGTPVSTSLGVSAEQMNPDALVQAAPKRTYRPKAKLMALKAVVSDETGVKKTPRRWSEHEDAALRAAVAQEGAKNWKKIATYVPGRNHVQCLQRWKKVLCPGLKKGHWTEREDELLRGLVAKKPKNWGEVCVMIPGRTAKQCRERWCNHLDPRINRDPWTPGEDSLLLASYNEIGQCWSLISQRLPGRTENAVKIRWKTLTRESSRGGGRRSKSARAPRRPRGEGKKKSASRPPPPAPTSAPAPPHLLQRRSVPPASSPAIPHHSQPMHFPPHEPWAVGGAPPPAHGGHHPPGHVPRGRYQAPPPAPPSGAHAPPPRHPAAAAPRHGYSSVGARTPRDPAPPAVSAPLSFSHKEAAPPPYHLHSLPAQQGNVSPMSSYYNSTLGGDLVPPPLATSNLSHPSSSMLGSPYHSMFGGNSNAIGFGLDGPSLSPSMQMFGGGLTPHAAGVLTPPHAMTSAGMIGGGGGGGAAAAAAAVTTSVAAPAPSSAPTTSYAPPPPPPPAPLPASSSIASLPIPSLPTATVAVASASLGFSSASASLAPASSAGVATTVTTAAPSAAGVPHVKRRVGRPKGSSRATQKREAALRAQEEAEKLANRPPSPPPELNKFGRPVRKATKKALTAVKRFTVADGAIPEDATDAPYVDAVSRRHSIGGPLFAPPASSSGASAASLVAAATAAAPSYSHRRASLPGSFSATQLSIPSAPTSFQPQPIFSPTGHFLGMQSMPGLLSVPDLSGGTSPKPNPPVAALPPTPTAGQYPSVHYGQTQQPTLNYHAMNPSYAHPPKPSPHPAAGGAVPPFQAIGGSSGYMPSPSFGRSASPMLNYFSEMPSSVVSPTSQGLLALGLSGPSPNPDAWKAAGVATPKFGGAGTPRGVRSSPPPPGGGQATIGVGGAARACETSQLQQFLSDDLDEDLTAELGFDPASFEKDSVLMHGIDGGV